MSVLKSYKVAFLTTLLLATFGCYLLHVLSKVLIGSIERSKLQRDLFEGSKAVLSKYDSSRGRNSRKPLKLSSNSYDDDMNRFAIRKIHERENATLLMLVRNWELPGALKSMRSLEDRFNRDYNYDWTFLNDEPFDETFIEATTAMASGKTRYALVPTQHWDRPEWIDEDRFEKKLQLMQDKGVLYGGSRSYRNMCRFNSGYFFRQKVLETYDYYFRVEPDVEYYCDFPYDPFKVMRRNNKKYGFVIAIYEYEDTIPTLWDAVEEYMEENKEDINLENNSYGFLTDSDLLGVLTPIVDSNSDYNLCHFWSNFEIGDLNFFRSDRYKRYFEFLDSKGGFYYERWGDAPVHSIGAALLLNRDEIIHFDELGYYHNPYYTCPTSYHMRLQQRCQCNPHGDGQVDTNPNSCLMRWWKNGAGKTFLKYEQ
ncbi:YUR1 (YJL139C) and KTR2 (YKR061W) [Zygosaccharomyces parabailii]|uniref:BN860_05314g1_1 n=1 Tax=Zygosaccharomyces bailii (strain CLIB 213 / ATCC 58445 / CBS 680 / BCRC 21525 / NBRC 1098 / NCYC 1416 / NRRL Y-2227) TaxID=1333698 RepID=A0A8J2X4Y7_ZYGB2|nr:YUR1 (YJL139C) and KTR2 (YKR061W) [Zygosaccharomyces parabailii]CDF87391.1 BN860_05314g1_1 [Zygosaccharomyces bailii CLIB 213]CDH15543.1 probable mannosyltransferase KTR2 [Zygosaccharomyces bailii ISA1307]